MVEIAKAIGADARDRHHGRADRVADRARGRRACSASSRVLRAEGAGIIYISHRLEEIFADRRSRSPCCATARRSRRATPRAIERAELIRLMVGRELSTVFPKRAVHARRGRARAPTAVESRASGIRDVSFAVRRGEILGIAGLVGSGRTELAETLFGLRRPTTGEILVDGAAVTASTRRADAIRARASAMCRRIAASTASCSRCRSRPMPAWPVCGASRAAA